LVLKLDELAARWVLMMAEEMVLMLGQAMVSGLV